MDSKTVMNSTSSQMEKNVGMGFKSWPSWIGRIAILWSVLYGAMHLYWLLGGAGYPFDASMDLFRAMVTYLPVKAASAVFVVLSILGIFIGIAMQMPRVRVFPKWLILTYAWGFAVSLLLFIPDISLIMVMAYAFLFKFDFNWMMFNQIICIMGALVWSFTAIAYQRTTSNACEHCGRTEDGKKILLVQWARPITYIAALAPLPYALSRFAWALGIPFGVDPKFLEDFSSVNPTHHITEWVFGSVCIGGGLLTLGLIQKWGEVFPSWFPIIGSRRVPILLAVIPASLVAIAVTAAGFVFTFAFFTVTLGLMPVDNIIVSQIWGAVGPMVFWVPWGAALGLAAVAYYYRRRGQCAHCRRSNPA
ncbi:hypothetical protein [Metabacillus arenae]|uniref:DUF3995 domain-containing protein n=1 Tax=Metabacillus arenae TaxID=2771434 RepID=A0A926S044_9BACI|nr:hypothetical protein [Metabacillus arenae]MBD1382877.1 hypothetical protein [Metabacillus arenae]